MVIIPKVTYGTEKVQKIKKNKQEKITCSKCGLIKSANINNFFKTENPLYNEIFPTCKDCVYELYNSHIQSGLDVRESTIRICELLDRPFLEDLFYNTFEKEQDSNKFLGIYLKNSMMQQYKKQGVVRFKDSIFNKNSLQAQESAFNDNLKIYNEEWNGYYTQSDISYLNKYLKGLHDDFKIITTSHKDYAKKIAQASLAMDKAFQEMSNGTNGADKRYKDLQSTFDTLSKSAQFSESQRGINDVSLGCFGVIFDKVEKRMFVPQHQPKDIDVYDQLLEQFANINKSL